MFTISICVETVFPHVEDLGNNVRSSIINALIHILPKKGIWVSQIGQYIVVTRTYNELSILMSRFKCLKTVIIKQSLLHNMPQMDVFSEPPFLVKTAETLPVASKILIKSFSWLKGPVPSGYGFGDFKQIDQFLKRIKLCSPENGERYKNKGHACRVNSSWVVENPVLRVRNIVWVIQRQNFIEKHLSISKLPVCHADHHNGRVTQYLQSPVIESIVKQWWLSVEKCELDPLGDVNVQNSN